MKYKMFLLAMACLGSSMAMAQNTYDIARFSGSDLVGTARFVGMGGAMGALGADMTTMGTNPAGIGLFRHSTWAGTLNYNWDNTKSVFNGNSFGNIKRNGFSFDQLGFVMANRSYDPSSSLKFLNFGFNYRKRKNLNKELWAGGNVANGVSQTMQMAVLMKGLTVGNIDAIHDFDLSPNNSGNSLENPYQNNNLPVLGVMGVRTDLLGLGNSTNAPEKETAILKPWFASDNGFKSFQTGGVQDFDFNVSANLNDRWYLGATLGISNVDYTRSVFYTEGLYDNKDNQGNYILNSESTTTGVGVNLKLGAIWRPFETNPFRLGLAIETPTWYALRHKNYGMISSNIFYKSQKPGEKDENISYNEDSRDYFNDGDIITDYQMSTPWKINLSAGTVLARRLALGAEYEYANYGNSSLAYNDGSVMAEENRYVSKDLNEVNTLRLGAEFRALPYLSIRAGYNYSSALMSKNASRIMPSNSVSTTTDFTNDFSRNTFTLGLGIDKGSYFIDAAYKYTKYNSDFYAFSADALPAAKVDNSRSSLMLTLGIRM